MDIYVIEGNPRNWKEAIWLTSNKLLIEGCVKETFFEACINRETEVPTGLPTPVNVAIPHADPEHVNKPALCFLKLSSPVRFQEMGDSENSVDALFVINLALNNADLQLHVLQNLMNVIQNEYLMRKLYDTSTEGLKKKLKELMFDENNSQDKISMKRSNMLQDLKELVVRIAKEAEDSGMCKPGSGNFSARDIESGLIAITPSQIPRKDLTPNHILIIDLEGKIIENELNVKPTSETAMHIEAYKTRPDVNGVVHTHSKYATAFAIQGMPIEPVVFESIAYGERAPVAPFKMPGTQDLADSLKPLLLEGYNAILMEKHGSFVVGHNLSSALEGAQYLEEVAEMTFIATVIGGKLPSRINKEMFDKFRNK